MDFALAAAAAVVDLAALSNRSTLAVFPLVLLIFSVDVAGKCFDVEPLALLSSFLVL